MEEKIINQISETKRNEKKERKEKLAVMRLYNCQLSANTKKKKKIKDTLKLKNSQTSEYQSEVKCFTGHVLGHTRDYNDTTTRENGKGG